MIFCWLGLAWASPTVGIDLHETYPAGRPIVLTLSVRNDGTDPLTVPDLSARPWLVRFGLVDEADHKQTRSQPVPDVDPGSVWNIPPRSQRQVLLEIPGSGGFDPGTYRLALEVTSLEADSVGGTFRLREPGVVAVDLADPVSPDSTFLDLWIDGIRPPYQGYLRSGEKEEPQRELENHWVMEVKTPPLAPILSSSMVGRPWTRHVVWLEGQGLHVVAVTGRGVLDRVRRHDIPWPQGVLFRAAATDGSGRLVVPVWVPSPAAGKGGEVKVAVLDGTGPLRFHRLGTFPTAPLGVAVVVEPSGNVRLLVRTERSVDHFLLRVDTAPGLPLKGERLLSIPVLDGGFGPDGAGGPSMWTIVREPDRFRIDWFSTDGSVLGSHSFSGPAGDVADVIPDPEHPAIAVRRKGPVKSGEVPVVVLSAAGETTFKVPTDAARWRLYTKPDGTVGVRVFDADGRVTVR